jgi:hypothetical protein
VSGRADDTFALAWRNPDNGEWWFVPTVPAARRWRGPYPTEPAMKVAATAELGSGVTITVTKCAPAQLARPARGAGRR